jgi:hypothetical protein
MSKLIHKELSGTVIGSSMEGPNEFKPGRDLALLLNFKGAKLEWKRVVQRQRQESDSPDLYANSSRIRDIRNAIGEIHRGLRRFFWAHCATHSWAADYRPTLSCLTIILSDRLSDPRYQRNPRSKVRLRRQPRWVIRGSLNQPWR